MIHPHIGEVIYRGDSRDYLIKMPFSSRAGESDGRLAKLQADFDRLAQSRSHVDEILVPRPFDILSARQVRPRSWIFGQHYIRGHISMTASQGGSGKSSLALAEAVSMARGVGIKGESTSPYTVLYFNNEDDIDETNRRVLALVEEHSLTQSDLGGRLICADTENGTLILDAIRSIGKPDEPLSKQRLVTYLKNNNIDVVVLDPLVSLHQENENDPVAMAGLFAVLKEIAIAANCAIEVLHHTRKSNDHRLNGDHVRGSSAIIGSLRSVRVINPVSESSAKSHGVWDCDASSYFSLTIEKSNMAKAGSREYYRISETTVEYQCDEEDLNGMKETVAVVSRCELPVDGHQFSEDEAVDALKLFKGQSFRFHPQAADWIGRSLAASMKISEDDRMRFKKWVIKFIDSEIQNGSLKKSERKNQKGKLVPIVEVL